MLSKGNHHRGTTSLLRKSDKVAQQIVMALMHTVKESNGSNHLRRE
jgi:hypothetical protein